MSKITSLLKKVNDLKFLSLDCTGDGTQYIQFTSEIRHLKKIWSPGLNFEFWKTPEALSLFSRQFKKVIVLHDAVGLGSYCSIGQMSQDPSSSDRFYEAKGEFKPKPVRTIQGFDRSAYIKRPRTLHGFECDGPSSKLGGIISVAIIVRDP